MKLEVGMYVRTKHKGIIKINEVIDNGVIEYEDDFGNVWEQETNEKVIRYISNDGWNCGLNEKEIIKTSHTLLGNDKEDGVIEAGDYVNGMRVDSIGKTLVYHFYTNDVECAMFEKDIKSIVTKEQFESMSYKVGE